MDKLGLKSINLRYLLGKTNLKRDLLYFDKLIFDENELKMSKMLSGPLGETLLGKNQFEETQSFQLAELDYLQDKNLLQSFDSNKLEKVAYQNELKTFTEYFDEHKKDRLLFSRNDVMNLGSIFQESTNILHGLEGNGNTIYKNYFFSELINATSDVDVIPIFDLFIPEKKSDLGKEYKILEVVLKKFPVIDDSVSWDQLIEFKNDTDSKRKFLALRNWMIDISKGSFDTKEISEKFDYLYLEYEAHLKRHKLKTNSGVIKTFAITTSEILEDLIRIKWSKAVKAGFEIFEESTKLTEIESNAPGKEVGYVYDMEQKLGVKQLTPTTNGSLYLKNEVINPPLDSLSRFYR
jgi:hypothetical protein